MGSPAHMPHFVFLYSAHLCADLVTELEALSAWKWTRAASPNRI